MKLLIASIVTLDGAPKHKNNLFKNAFWQRMKEERKENLNSGDTLHLLLLLLPRR